METGHSHLHLLERESILSEIIGEIVHIVHGVEEEQSYFVSGEIDLGYMKINCDGEPT